ncbi:MULTISPECIES: SRPBCC family protein [Robiginitalea]|uniref:Polyketide cyclase n=1 Tax=Robiginitalea biformata (strain ATCC BAA-864 / DSM 15991 / KCTC 12146 / HTCC2501) TaxID=313596 RepID=A4CNH2_ROBBH|nr:hypothetical protein RB2501_00146 [Robiginitalea biformata HTCC2501]
MTFIYILAAILVLLIILYLIAPARYDVSRNILINRPPAVVFEYLKYLKNQDEWSPWAKRDPDMKKEYRGTDGTVGFVSSWEGNKEVGAGEQEITRIQEGSRIESELRFLKPWKSTSDAYIEVEPAAGDATRVRWGFSGQNGFPMRLMMLVMSMDKMVGKDFEEGLASLKTRLESKE